VVNVTPWSLYFWERDTLPILQEAESTSGQAWKGVENNAPKGGRILNRKIRSESQGKNIK
jgi:hypothetical protein